MTSKFIFSTLILVLCLGVVWKKFLFSGSSDSLDGAQELRTNSGELDEDSLGAKGNKILNSSSLSSSLTNNEDGKNFEGQKLKEMVTPESNLKQSPSATGPISFQKMASQLGECLDIKNAALESEPTFKNLLEDLRGEVGHPIANFEDWTNEHLKLRNGEIRRIRLEFSQDSQGLPLKNLRLYKLDREGLPELMPPIANQEGKSVDESLAQLREGAEVVLNERSLRSYFQSGEELMVVERNGRIAEVEMLKESKAFKCTNLEEKNANCSCSR